MAGLNHLAAEPVPITKDGSGVWRVGGTRVSLDTVISAFNQGCAAEEILLKYPSLQLRDIYAVITYYLWHQEEIKSYLDERRVMAEEVREENERRFPSSGIRDRLLSRQAPRE